MLREVAREAINTRIGHILRLSEAMVMIHLQNIMAKLHLASRGEAAAYAWKSGFQRPME